MARVSSAASVRTIAFCATGKTGLGHLRRVTNIAASLREQGAEFELALLTNSPLEGLGDSERALYGVIDSVPRQAMAERLRTLEPAAVVVDTAVLPGLHQVDAPLGLVLRETVPAKVTQFMLEQGRRWDLVIVPNPADAWLPEADQLPAHQLVPVGWIYRRLQAAGPLPLGLHDGADARTVLIASGGGGNTSTQAIFTGHVEAMVRALRDVVNVPMSILQNAGMRANAATLARGVDRLVDCGSALNEAFAQVDLVVSTVGYNSVLELACTDVPVVLVPIARTFDDQDERARSWGARLGMHFEPSDPMSTARWMADMLERRWRRAPVDLGPSGAGAAARLIAQLSDCRC